MGYTKPGKGQTEGQRKTCGAPIKMRRCWRPAAPAPNLAAVATTTCLRSLNSELGDHGLLVPDGAGPTPFYQSADRLAFSPDLASVSGACRDCLGWRGGGVMPGCQGVGWRPRRGNWRSISERSSSCIDEVFRKKKKPKTKQRPGSCFLICHTEEADWFIDTGPRVQLCWYPTFFKDGFSQGGKQQLPKERLSVSIVARSTSKGGGRK